MPCDRCDICETELSAVKYDAKIAGGGWADLCAYCFSRMGCTLGTGRGQKYERRDGAWIKTEG